MSGPSVKSLTGYGKMLKMFLLSRKCSAKKAVRFLRG